MTAIISDHPISSNAFSTLQIGAFSESRSEKSEQYNYYNTLPDRSPFEVGPAFFHEGQMVMN
jgi:hypothetical protein